MFYSWIRKNSSPPNTFQYFHHHHHHHHHQHHHHHSYIRTIRTIHYRTLSTANLVYPSTYPLQTSSSNELSSSSRFCLPLKTSSSFSSTSSSSPRSLHRCFSSTTTDTNTLLDTLVATEEGNNNHLWDTTQQLLDGILQGDRTSLARAITLVESTRIEHRQQAELLLDTLASFRQQQQTKYESTLSYGRKHVHVSSSSSSNNTINPNISVSSSSSVRTHTSTFFPPYRSFRIGIAGPPGAGKSTLIEALGLYLVEQCNERVAVIAIDPSSPRTGGSILGDKTRMNKLSCNPAAFVRPSPSRGALGGITTTTHDVIHLCEASNFPIILVETVGLGQSETAVDNCVDMLWLVVPPGGGDELQGIKKGIVECADMIVINKADGDLTVPARHMAAEYTRAMQLVRPKHGFGVWYPPVLRCSALTNEGIVELWNKSKEFYTILNDKFLFQQRRNDQAVLRVWTDFDNNLNRKVKMNPKIQTMANQLQERVAKGFVTSRKAANDLVTAFLGTGGGTGGENNEQTTK